MPQTNIQITGGTPPFTIQVAEASTNAPVVCTAGCGSSASRSRVVSFQGLAGTHSYKYTIRDSGSPGCVQTQMTPALTCSVAPPPPPQAPSFSLSVTQPACVGFTPQTTGKIKLVGVAYGDRYKFFLKGTTPPANATGATEFSGATIEFPVPAPAQGTSKVYVVRLYSGQEQLGTRAFTDREATLTMPVCTSPEVCSLTITLGTPSVS